jgi:hypothetical protein
MIYAVLPEQHCGEINKPDRMNFVVVALNGEMDAGVFH